MEMVVMVLMVTVMVIVCLLQGGNVLTETHLRRIKEVEMEVMSHPLYLAHCMRTDEVMCLCHHHHHLHDSIDHTGGWLCPSRFSDELLLAIISRRRCCF